jgi:hypothetical protein
MPLSEDELQSAEARFARLSPALARLFRDTISALPPDFSEDQARRLINDGLNVANASLRSWETCADYLRAAPSVLPRLDEATFTQWATDGAHLGGMAAPIAAAYFQASPAVLPLLQPSQLSEWAAIGEGIARSTWKSIWLTSHFFNLSPLLLQRLTLAQLGLLGHVIEGIADRSPDLAAECLEASPVFVQAFNPAEITAFLNFADVIARIPWPEAGQYFRNDPALVLDIDAGHRAAFLQFAAGVGKQLRNDAYRLLSETIASLRRVRPLYHGQFVSLAARLLQLSPLAATAILKSAPTVSVRLKPDEIDVWFATGWELLAESTIGGEAYFSLESNRSLEIIAALSRGVELKDVTSLLRLYGKALTGASLAIESVDALEEKGIGWVRERGATTEGTTVYLPDFIRKFEDRRDNFRVFKVFATHQAAHIEFGSFRFRFGREGNVLPRRRHLVEEQRQAEGIAEKDHWVTDMERFFDLLPRRQLGADLFAVSEDMRLDRRVAYEYSGLHSALIQVQRVELGERPEVMSLPLREAFVEDLIRYTLDPDATLHWPEMLTAILAQALTILDRLNHPQASVEDAAEATLLLYDLASLIPNLPPERTKGLSWASQSGAQMKSEAGEEDGTSSLDELPEGEEVDYRSPAQVDFHGDFKPELVQLLMRMRGERPEEDQDEFLSVLTSDDVKQMLQKSVELLGGAGGNEMQRLLENLAKEASTDSFASSVPEEEEEPMLASGSEPVEDDAPDPEVHTFYYDEWDYRYEDYRPSWCSVHERNLEEGSADFYVRTLHEYGRLAIETQRQFEMLKPDNFRKIKRLEDGEDIDLDAAIDFVMQKKSGHGDIGKIYWRRNKVQRDVAVAFLLDMSISTEDEVDRVRHSGDVHDPHYTFGGPISLFNKQAKRIIDLEKESIVLLTHALEVIGDRYAIYGFSGYGRENVDFFIIKGLDEAFNETVQRRIDKIEPVSATRMGPAIRHATAKLAACDARARILFLVSDGRPQDYGYGRDHTEKQYAIHDTHKALIEARQQGITPFALTVDKEGHDYLGEMCADMGYEVLDNIELLPSRLPTLYRRLTQL